MQLILLLVLVLQERLDELKVVIVDFDIVDVVVVYVIVILETIQAKGCCSGVGFVVDIDSEYVIVVHIRDQMS